MTFSSLLEINVITQRAMLLCVVMLAAIVGLVAQTPEWQWAVSGGGTGQDYCYEIATDSQGNLYVTGEFQGIATFGPFILTSSGASDIFAAKLGPAGDFLWAVSAGGTNSDEARDITVDNAGNALLTGIFQETATFGTYTITSSGMHDIFAAKIDPAGNFLWAVRAGGENYDQGFGIATDSADNVWLTGNFALTASFGTYTLTTTGLYDVFAAKLDPVGNFLWAVKAGGASYDFGKGIAVDSAGNACLTGNFYDTASFGSYTISSAGCDDVFTAKLDSAGNWLWAACAGGTSFDRGQNIAIDSAGNIWLTGSIGGGTASFGAANLTSNGSIDIFICKLDSAGNFLWAANAGGANADYGYGITIDSAGNAWLTGLFKETATFGTQVLTSGGDFDIFICKLDATGQFIWVTNTGGTSADHGYGIITDGAGNAWVTGYYEETASFGSHTLTSAGLEDIFVAKLASGTLAEDELHPPVVSPVLSASPNPFAASTSIKLAGEKLGGWSDNASLVIYNLRGQEVRSLSLANAGKNGFELNWDGRDECGIPCPNGIYLALFDLGSRRATLKLSLLR